MHVGRGKAGSTTIQRAMMENRAALKAQGMIYPLPQPPYIRHLEVKAAVHSAQADQQPLERLIRQIKRNPDLDFVLSDEGLLQFEARGDPSRARRLISSSPQGVTVIVYVREYGRWVVSLYGQRTKKARWVEDFDSYFERTRKHLSVMPRLAAYADLVGWENLRVRSLDPANLAGGGLLTDFADAIEVPDPAKLNFEIADQNVARSWMAVEFRRAVATCLGPDEAPHEAVIVRLMKRFAKVQAAQPAGPARVAYLTSAQAREAAEIYNRDVAAINAKLGTSIPESPAGDPPERPFLPSVDALPAEVRTGMARVLREAYIRNQPAESRAGLERLGAMLAP